MSVSTEKKIFIYKWQWGLRQEQCTFQQRIPFHEFIEQGSSRLPEAVILVDLKYLFSYSFHQYFPLLINMNLRNKSQGMQGCATTWNNTSPASSRLAWLKSLQK